MAQGSGLTRGDRNRNRRIAVVREMVRRDRGVLAVDLGEDKQVAVVLDHEGRALARKVVRVSNATPTQLTVTGFTGLVAGNLTASVTVNGQNSTAVQVATVQPVVTLSTSTHAASTSQTLTQTINAATATSTTLSASNILYIIT